MKNSWLTLEQAARKFSFSEKRILLLVASKSVSIKTRQVNGNLLLVNEQDLANLGFVRQEETVDLAQRLKRGAINIINAVGVALAVKILMNVDLSQILHIIIKYNIYTLPSPPGMSEESAEFVREDEAEIEELASRLIQEDYPRGTV